MTRYGPPTRETDEYRSTVVVIEEGRPIALPVHRAVLLQRRQMADLACYGFRYGATCDPVRRAGLGPVIDLDALVELVDDMADVVGLPS